MHRPTPQEKRPEHLPIECAVIFKSSGQLLDYDKEGNFVFPNGDTYHLFPSKMRAKSAVNTAIEMRKLEGVERPQDDYEIVEV